MRAAHLFRLSFRCHACSSARSLDHSADCKTHFFHPCAVKSNHLLKMSCSGDSSFKSTCIPLAAFHALLRSPPGEALHPLCGTGVPVRPAGPPGPVRREWQREFAHRAGVAHGSVASGSCERRAQHVRRLGPLSAVPPAVILSPSLSLLSVCSLLSMCSSCDTRYSLCQMFSVLRRVLLQCTTVLLLSRSSVVSSIQDVHSGHRVRLREDAPVRGHHHNSHCCALASAAPAALRPSGRRLRHRPRV